MTSPRTSPRPTISLLHATRGRPDLALAAREQWLKAATHPERVEHIFAVDFDDAPTLEAVADLPHRVVAQRGGGCVAAWNLAADASTGDVLVQLSDDWTPTAGWDEEFVRRLRDVSQSAVLRPSDGHRRDDLLCMAILTRARYEQQGEFLHHGYQGVFSDDEFSFRAYLDGVVIDARDLVLTHHHPFYDSNVAHDETYANQNNAERSSSGRDLFLKRNPKAMGHWLHENTWERFFVPLGSAAVESTAKASAGPQASPVDETANRAQQKTLLTAAKLFLERRAHTELFRATALQTKDLITGVKKTLGGKLILKSEELRPFRKCLEGAKRRLKRRSMLDACFSYLQATRLGLEVLNRVKDHFLVKSKSLSSSIDQVRAQYRRQRNWLRKLRRWADDLPGVEQDATWGLDPSYYSQQAGLYFSSRVKAARHYEKVGWQKGLNPHSLFDTQYFQKQNAAWIDPQANPLEEYHRLVDEGDAPEAHPKFPGKWLRKFFRHSYDNDSKTSPAAIPDPPVKLDAARAFANRVPVLSVAVILNKTAEPQLQHLLLSFVQASQRLMEAGGAAPRLLVTDLSQEWSEESFRKTAGAQAPNLQFFSSPSSSSWTQASNALLKAAFASAETTHCLCLHPEFSLHPDALVEFVRTTKANPLPALIEGRQFPHEHPKDYDAASLKTNWSSGRCLLVPRFLFELTSGFDESFQMQGSDVDLCWRAWQNGYCCLMAPSAIVYSHASEGSDPASSERQKLEAGRILGEKWRMPRYRLECERQLVERGLYRNVDELAVITPANQFDPHMRVDFENKFTFAKARW